MHCICLSPFSLLIQNPPAFFFVLHDTTYLEESRKVVLKIFYRLNSSNLFFKVIPVKYLTGHQKAQCQVVPMLVMLNLITSKKWCPPDLSIAMAHFSFCISK